MTLPAAPSLSTSTRGTAPCGRSRGPPRSPWRSHQATTPTYVLVLPREVSRGASPKRRPPQRAPPWLSQPRSSARREASRAPPNLRPPSTQTRFCEPTPPLTPHRCAEHRPCFAQPQSPLHCGRALGWQPNHDPAHPCGSRGGARGTPRDAQCRHAERRIRLRLSSMVAHSAFGTRYLSQEPSARRGVGSVVPLPSLPPLASAAE